MRKWTRIGAAGLIAAAGLAGAAVAAERTAADRQVIEWAQEEGYALSPAPERRSGNDIAAPARRKLVRTSGEPPKRRLRYPMPVFIGAFR